MHDIFDTLPDNPTAATTGTDDPDNAATPAVDDYRKAVAKLDTYFNPRRNVDYETYVFRQARQKQGETLDMFQSRLRQLASTCKFTDINREIKAQVVAGCLSTRLRRQALRDPNVTLTDLLDHGRALETSESQAFGIEKQATPEVNQLSLRFARGKSKHHKSRQTTQCYNCGGDYPHKKGRTGCPAYGAECGKCGQPNHYAQYCKSQEGVDTGRKQSDTGNTTPAKPKKAHRRHRRQVNQVDINEAFDSSSDDGYTYLL